MDHQGNLNGTSSSEFSKTWSTCCTTVLYVSAPWAVRQPFAAGMKLHLRFEVPAAYTEDPGADCEGSVEINSRIRDYQWLPCHTVSIRSPQISRTRFVVDCSASLPALGWLVAFCAAKAWRTNAHSLRSLGTQSRKDRKREESKSLRRVFFPVLRAGAPQWGTAESVSNLSQFFEHLNIGSFSGSFFLCEFGLDHRFCCFGSDLESQSNLELQKFPGIFFEPCNIDQESSLSSLSSFTDQWWVMRCVEYHVSHQRIPRSDCWWAVMLHHEKQW